MKSVWEKTLGDLYPRDSRATTVFPVDGLKVEGTLYTFDALVNGQSFWGWTLVS